MTLHDRIRAVVEERLRLAREVRGEPWDLDGDSVNGSVFVVGRQSADEVAFLSDGNVEAIGRHIAANDPADAILSAEHALGILERHAMRQMGPFGALCEGCSITEGTEVYRFVASPCEPLLALATRWRVEVDG